MADPFTPDEPVTISVSVKSHPGYGATLVNFAGTPDKVATLFGLPGKDDGSSYKASEILAQVSKVEAWYQENHQATLKEMGVTPGKASAPETGRPGQPAGSLTAPEWMGEAPRCDHGVTMAYKRVFRKDSTYGHLWECTARVYPDPEQCKSIWRNKEDSE